MTRTGKLVHEETSSDWSAAFVTAWASHGGHLQSLGFAVGAIRELSRLPEFTPLLTLHRPSDTSVAYDHFSVHDYGCACGDGTAALAAAFAGASVVGFDTSMVAVRKARDRWPGVEFKVGDVKAPRENATVIFTSHTIEHTSDAAACVNGLLERCQVLVVLVPWISEMHHGGHEGAEATAEWLKRCPEPLHRAAFNTMRRNPDAGVWLAEGSLMFVWQGELR